MTRAPAARRTCLTATTPSVRPSFKLISLDARSALPASCLLHPPYAPFHFLQQLLDTQLLQASLDG